MIFSPHDCNLASSARFIVNCEFYWNRTEYGLVQELTSIAQFDASLHLKHFIQYELGFDSSLLLLKGCFASRSASDCACTLCSTA